LQGQAAECRPYAMAGRRFVTRLFVTSGFVAGAGLLFVVSALVLLFAFGVGWAAFCFFFAGGFWV